jgi:hypothetical protein
VVPAAEHVPTTSTTVVDEPSPTLLMVNFRQPRVLVIHWFRL